MIQSGSSAASASHSSLPPTRSGLTVGKSDGESILVLVRKRLFRDGIQLVLQAPGRTISGSCESLDQVASKVSALSSPDLVVVGGYGLEHSVELFRGIRKLRARIPSAKW